MDIILLGEPKSTSHIYKMTCRGRFASMYMSKEGKDLKKSYIEQAKKQYEGKVMKGDIEIWIELYFGTKRKSDWDNYHKLSMDALSGVVWGDDTQIKVAHVWKLYDKDKPRIELTIKEY